MDPQRGNRSTMALMVAAGVIVVALVAALIVSLVTSGGDDSDGGETAAPPAPAEQEQEPTLPPPTGDETTDADPLGRPVTVVESASGTPREQDSAPGGFPTGAEMVGAPDGYELQRVRSGVTVAVSSSDGPTKVEGQVMTGYAQSARGAGLLATNLVGLTMSTAVATKEFLTTFAPADQREQTANMGGYSHENEELAREHLVDGYAAPQHVRFLTCESEFCTVEVAEPALAEMVGQIDASEGDPNMHLVTRVSMKWAEDQWEMVSVTPRQERELDGSWERWS